ncbi:protein kinase ALK1 [Saccharomyces eubayanus]|uniref:protein kinase ALK1 n=1 Tax=Saccharomyces eubayanus TaxID=1080349 RepID=UPI0006C0A835|nr:ALK1-like protein [Saccharomyces eubayanus]KOG99485.1 ALK1-like protein [Saccharomyces eubayanus]
MDFETSFEEFVEDKRFIALEVSDNDDDYDTDLTTETGDELDSSVIPRMRSSKASLNTTGHSIPRKNTNNSKKRWSLLSNHSTVSSSKSKKRWSVLSSSFTSETHKDRDPRGTSQQKRKSLQSYSSLDTVASNTSLSASSSLKRSSTGLSLRQLFTKIVINDETPQPGIGIPGGKENLPPTSNKKTLPIAPIGSEQNRLRTPLKPLNNQARRSTLQQQQQYQHQHQQPQSLVNASFSSRRSSISSTASSSSASKWKFWKKDRSMPPPMLQADHHSMNSFSVVNRRDSATPVDPRIKVKHKSSFSEFHKAIFNSNTYSESSDTVSSMETSLKTKASSSSLSLGVLKNRNSQSSLKHKSSHASLQKFKRNKAKSSIMAPPTTTSSSNDDSCSYSSKSSTLSHRISLPVPDQVSRDKIQNKLRNSNSLLSLNSTTSSPMNKNDHDESLLRQILQNCDIKKILNPAKGDILPLINDASHLSSIQLTSHIWQIGEVICKKIALGSINDITWDTKFLSLQELEKYRIMKQKFGGIPQLLKSFVVKEANNTLCLYLLFKDHGTPISLISLKNWKQILKIFWSCVGIINNLETNLKFEHRNLTLDNILMDGNGNITIIDFKCSRLQTPQEDVLCLRLDHPLFFPNGKDKNKINEYQYQFEFEIYQSMRILLNMDSKVFEPMTNLYWLYYLSRILLRLGDRKLGKNDSNRDKLAKVVSHLEMNLAVHKRGGQIFKRLEATDIKNTGDLLKLYK